MGKECERVKMRTREVKEARNYTSYTSIVHIIVISLSPYKINATNFRF